jgi:hypothetical protein
MPASASVGGIFHRTRVFFQLAFPDTLSGRALVDEPRLPLRRHQFADAAFGADAG